MYSELSDFSATVNNSLAIFIGKTSFGNHCGILVKHQEEVRIYHLAWHLMLRLDSEKTLLESADYQKINWVDFVTLNEKNDPFRARTLATIKWLQVIYEKNNKDLPYACN